MARSLCSGGVYGGCGRVFSSTSEFDEHRTGDYGGTGGTGSRRCMTDDELAAADFIAHPMKRDTRGTVYIRAKRLAGTKILATWLQAPVVKRARSNGHSLAS